MKRWISAVSLSLLFGSLISSPAEAVQFKRLTDDTKDQNWATWSPDGQTVLFSTGPVPCGGTWFCGEQSIWSMKVLGSQLSPPTLWMDDAYHPRMSPDGQWVAGMVHNGDDWDILVWAADGTGQPVAFQSQPDADERFPNWSNDSQFIAFDSDRTGNQDYQIYYAPFDEPHDPAAAIRVSFLGRTNKHPTWSADDTELAYVGNAENQRSISAVNLVTGAYREVTPHASQNRHPDWSPDGKWIAFTTDRWDGVGDIAIVRADGRGVPTLVTVGMDGHDDFPEWSHDSQRLLFMGMTETPVQFPETPVPPQREIYIASDLPFEEAWVATRKKSISSLKSGFNEQ